MHRPKLWHPSVFLEDFVKQVISLQQLIDMIRTPKLGSFDGDTVKRSMGWGLYAEQVIGSLTMGWQRDALVRALEAAFKANPPRVANLSRLRQARNWVLQSMLQSAFLTDHPRPQSLLKWIMTEYAEVSLEKGLDQVDPGLSAWSLAMFVGDATDVMKLSGNTAALSHAYSALSVCTVANADESNIAFSTVLPKAPVRVLPGLTTKSKNVLDFRRKMRRQPSTYGMSVETAQKRAYASNCYRVLLSKIKEEYPQGEACDEGTRFIAKMASLSSSEDVVMEVMCLMLLEPWRTCQVGRWARGTCYPTTATKSSRASKMLLQQVLIFRSDERLWSLDPWLLGEVSHHHSSFAHVYVAHLLKLGREVDDGDCVSTANFASRQEAAMRFASLSSRSVELKEFCRSVLAHAANARGDL